jgi:Lipocalin-like domain
MHCRDFLGLAASAALALALVPGVAVAQQKTMKELLPGAWTLLLADGVQADGTHVPLYGPNPVGTLMFSGNGHYATELMRSDLKPFASNNQDTGTAAENKEVATGTLSHFGTYMTDDAGKTFSFRIEGSSFPNFANTTAKRMVTALTDDVLTYNVPPIRGFDHIETVWRKAK